MTYPAGQEAKRLRHWIHRFTRKRSMVTTREMAQQVVDMEKELDSLRQRVTALDLNEAVLEEYGFKPDHGLAVDLLTRFKRLAPWVRAARDGMSAYATQEALDEVTAAYDAAVQP